MAEGYERATVNLIPKAQQALVTLGELTGITNKTDLINRALTLYGFIEQGKAQGRTLCWYADGKIAEIELL